MPRQATLHTRTRITSPLFLICRSIWITILLFAGLSLMAFPALGAAPAGPTVNSRMELFIPFALHLPVREVDGSIARGFDGVGNIVDGNAMPLYDTLIGIANPTAHPLNVRFKFFSRSGAPQTWGDGKTYRDYELGPDCSLATTLMRNNIFPDPPQSFVGYAILELSTSYDSHDISMVPVTAFIGGGGFYPDHWNDFGASVPVYRSSLPVKQQWLFPYAIPFFEDVNHWDALSYRTGMVITNFEHRVVSLKLTYTVGDFYTYKNRKFVMELALAAGESIVFDLYGELLKAGYPEGYNSEGWLKIESNVPAAVAPYALLSNKNYNRFSVGQSALGP